MGPGSTVSGGGPARLPSRPCVRLGPPAGRGGWDPDRRYPGGDLYLPCPPRVRLGPLPGRIDRTFGDGILEDTSSSAVCAPGLTVEWSLGHTNPWQVLDSWAQG